MSSKIRSRSLSQDRQRRSSLTTDQVTHPTNVSSRNQHRIYSGIDLRTPKQKIEDLEKDLLDCQHPPDSDEYLSQLILMQVYKNLEYGDISIENARAYISLSEFYFNRKKNFLVQAKSHALSARQILEQLKIKPSDENLLTNRLAYDIYFLLLKCSFNAKRESKSTRNKHILSIDKTHIDHDMQLIEKYLEKLKQLMHRDDYDQINMKYLMIKFDIITTQNFKECYNRMEDLIYQLTEYIEKFYSHEQMKRKIDLYLRSGSYFTHFQEKTSDGLRYFHKAVELAERQENLTSSVANKHQLAKAILERSIGKVRADHFTDELEKDFRKAIELYKEPSHEITKNVLKVIDELAVYYTKVRNYQDALNILCETLSDKKRLFGEFSEEVIQTESRIGAIYLREGECLNAAEHFKVCLDLQEFVYGSNDPRTSETRSTVDLLKKDPMVCRTFFARTDDGKRQDRPAFRTINRISYENQDLQLIQTMNHKPPMIPKI
ncbi:unnamed protein product [Adineta ricciae]|uniref:Uncharacterized protein n=1 Tax=Adineta ricciae TaxID=249248 RepID=A0A814CWK3_ADIRI|nr:unnamed protein product [Adineta ricciae]CAF0946029.1 unnamed protein product [Adineta ricciae]